MGFIVMISSVVIGTLLIIISSEQYKKNKNYIISLFVGIALVIFSIYLMLPK